MENSPKKLKRAATWMERSGFRDSQLTTKYHDEMLLWCKEKTQREKFILNYGLNMCIETVKEKCLKILRRDCFRFIIDKIDDEIRKHNSQYSSAIDILTGMGINKKTSSQFCIEHSSLLFKMLSKKFSNTNFNFCQQLINTKLEEWNKKEKNIEFPSPKIIYQSEYEIRSGHYSLGFVDLFGYVNYHIVDEYNDKEEDIASHFFIELKTEVNSLGSLLRELHFYKNHLPSPITGILVSPKISDDWIIILNEEGFEYIEYPGDMKKKEIKKKEPQGKLF